MSLPHQPEGDRGMSANYISAGVDPRYEDACPVMSGGLLDDLYGLCKGIVHLKSMLYMYFQHAGCFQIRCL